jgi:hypothetical protein
MLDETLALLRPWLGCFLPFVEGTLLAIDCLVAEGLYFRYRGEVFWL